MRVALWLAALWTAQAAALGARPDAARAQHAASGRDPGMARAHGTPSRPAQDAPESPRADGPRLAIRADSARREMVVELGPIDLPARTSHHAQEQLPVLAAAFPLSGYLHGFRIELVDANGRPVPQRVLHHVNLIDPAHRELFAPIARRLLAAGEETGPQRMPGWLFGVPVKAGDPLVVSSMFHNPTDVTYRGVRLRIVLPYTPAERGEPIFQVLPFQLDVMFPVGDKAYDLPPGRSERSYEARPAVAGRILAIGGHLHDYGVALRFEDVTAGKIIWEGRPILDEEGHVVGMPVGRLWWKLGARIVPDHVYRVTAIYDNPTGKTIPQGAMGVVGGILLPDDPQAWPETDRTDPTYVADVRHFLRLAPGAGHETAGHGGHGHRGAGHGSPEPAGSAPEGHSHSPRAHSHGHR